MSETTMNSDEMALVDAGLIIDAIRSLRNRTGCGLREAKDTVDLWVSSRLAAYRARRIKAALTAVEGIPTEALERGALKHVIDLAAWPYEGEHGSRCDEHEEGCPDCEMVAALVAIGRLK